LEEPTHRVERPGHAPVDPLSRSHPGVHFQAVRTILDHLPRVGESKTKKSKIEDTADYDRSLWIALGIFAFMLLLVAIYVVRSD
jgi:hypothetical protein